jgi:hypothetical protein
MITGMITAMIQPPVVNFVTIWMIDTTAVATAPMPFSHAFHFHPGALVVRQCTTIPA